MKKNIKDKYAKKRKLANEIFELEKQKFILSKADLKAENKYWDELENPSTDLTRLGKLVNEMEDICRKKLEVNVLLMKKIKLAWARNKAELKRMIKKTRQV